MAGKITVMTIDLLSLCKVTLEAAGNNRLNFQQKGGVYEIFINFGLAAFFERMHFTTKQMQSF